jgi:alanine dehydrogenase
MIIGTVKEILNNEYRVGITPAAAMAYILKGHQVLVQTKAGEMLLLLMKVQKQE